jgi:hypothetical protein
MTDRTTPHPEEHGHWDVEDIRALLHERDRLRADAARYRWLRAPLDDGHIIRIDGGRYPDDFLVGDEADDSIDAARAAGES